MQNLRADESDQMSKKDGNLTLTDASKVSPGGLNCPSVCLTAENGVSILPVKDVYVDSCLLFQSIMTLIRAKIRY